jgi:UDP:flavonoid glycosyltransferase YjiC (YdhE family)
MLSGVGWSTACLRNRIQQVLSDERYRASARRMQDAIGRAGGINRAADLIEVILPVDRSKVNRRELIR